MIKDPSLDHLIDYLVDDGVTPIKHWADATVTIDRSAFYEFHDMMEASFEAFRTWANTSGIQFELAEEGKAADIVFSHGLKGGAFTKSVFTSDGELISARINVPLRWDSDWSAGSYGFQTLLHEIGHALGLNHAGPYNGTGTYDDDAIFTKDTYQYSVMSYFDQSAADSHVKPFLVMTPMIADVAAIQQIYGELKVNEGDTSYGEFTPRAFKTGPAGSFINDTSGIDTLNVHGDIGDNINLRGGAFSDVMGLKKGLMIGENTIIENVVGSPFADTIKGNAADNDLSGSWGPDMIEGHAGNDTLRGGDPYLHFMPEERTDQWYGDTMRGGGGADTFAFARLNEFEDDLILDFKSGVDKLDFREINIRPGSVKTFFPAHYIGHDGFSGREGEIRWAFMDHKTVLQVDKNGDAVADYVLQFAQKFELLDSDVLI